MPEELKKSEIESHSDPAVTKQLDTETPKEEQFKKLYSLVDSKKICLLSTNRDGIGPVGRSMAIQKRVGPDFLFLANSHGQKFFDLEHDKTVQITLQDSSNNDWVSIAGKAVTISNSDPRIKDIWSNIVKAWFGDLGDDKHDGSANDPRMTLIEVKSHYIAYWLHDVGTLGLLKEVAVAAVTGKVAKQGIMRELFESDIEMARKSA
ncbi:hypothetical protein LTR66_006254 [Elasticomyces elasticus]|nr:hypothetical protein LTR66_006254 [Elasticomyces elasticus]